MSPFVCVVHWLAVVGSSIYTCLVGCIHEWCEDILTHKHKFTSSHVDMYIHTHKHPSAHPLHMYTHMYVCTYLVSLSLYRIKSLDLVCMKELEKKVHCMISRCTL